MPGTYSQLLFHVVFSTKHRRPFLTPALCERLYPYIGGIIRAERGVLLAIGGMPDHVHLLIRWRTDSSVADLMRTVKARSLRGIHETFPDQADFAWQEGYGVFSVSKSAASAVRAYIENQAAHHAQREFKAELVALLNAHDVEFEPRFID